LLWEPRRGVAGLAEWVDIDVDGAAEGIAALEGIPSPTGRSIGRSVTYFSEIDLQCSSGQHDAT